MNFNKTDAHAERITAFASAEVNELTEYEKIMVLSAVAARLVSDIELIGQELGRLASGASEGQVK